MTIYVRGTTADQRGNKAGTGEKLSSHTFFFYGSLMDVELLEAVLGRAPSHLSFTPGWLAGYAAETAHGYTFPTLVENRTARVDGLVTRGLTTQDVDRIAYFEDTEYAPVVLDIATADSEVAAQVFLATTSLRSSGELWSFDHWRAVHKPLLVAVTRRVMHEHYGTTPIHEIDAHWHRIKAEVEATLQARTVLNRTSRRRRARNAQVVAAPRDDII